jgi:phage shock protein C
MTHDNTPERQGPRSLQRTHDGRLLAGVCSGLGRYVGVDANIVRLVIVLLTAFGGTGAVVYAAGWLLVPEEGEDRSILQRMFKQG